MSEESGLPQPGAVVGGKYRVERAIGAGGMGAVFRATSEVTGKAVALKWLRANAATDSIATKRFVREAQAAARIRHPNVVDVYDVEQEGETAFLVLELLEGETLRSVLRRRPVLGIEECLTLLVPAMRGVAAAHAQGVVHRDIKPDNLFLTRDPDDANRIIPKVLDFGISKVAADTPLVEGTLTATGATLGTPHYMSLEQLQGLEVDARSDVYAFGVVLYECLTGKRPFDSENFSAIVVKAATETPVDPMTLRPEIPAGLRDVVLKAMARNRDDRYRSMLDLVDGLLPFTTDGAPAVLDTPPEDRSRAGSASPDLPTVTSQQAGREPLVVERSRRPWAFAAAGFVVVAGVFWWTRPTETATDDAAETATEATALAAAAAQAPTPTRQPSIALEPPAQTETSLVAGRDTEALPRATRGQKFQTGWVYLGEHDDGRWFTRYFDGWGDGVPRPGAKITARGRSNVRIAPPDDIGVLADVRTTIGPENALEVIEVTRWLGGGYVWARVQPAW